MADPKYYAAVKKMIREKCPCGDNGCGGFWKFSNKYLNGCDCCDLFNGPCVDSLDYFDKLGEQLEAHNG